MSNEKKMYDGGKVIFGLALFFTLVTFPFWFNHGKAAPAPEPKLTDKAKAEKICIVQKDLMKSEHMQILNDWRNMVVRNTDRIYQTSEGKRYEMSLSNTCLDCHSNKADFCDKCHNYVAVSPYCWDCHIDKPKETKE
ncbi:MAG: sulfate reduction electron transfer complex DsrMKJOP subunit DsrJ [Thermodesulfobacteriota bacterium]